MTSKYGTKTLTEILNLDSVKVNSYRQHEGIGIILQVELKKKVLVLVVVKSSLHQNHRYLVKDLPLVVKRVSRSESTPI